MLKHRVRSGFLMGGALLAALYFLPAEGAIAIIILLSACAMGEFFALLRAGGIPHLRITGMAGGLALLAGTWWSYRHGTGPLNPAESELAILFLVAAVVLVLQMFHGPLDKALLSMGGTMLGVLYAAWLFNFVNKLLLEFGAQEGRLLIFFLVLVVKMTDVGAFFIGCRLGGPKFFPRVSPAKTWSGVLGGVLTGLACSLAAGHFLAPHLTGLSFGLADAVALGLLLPVTGILGDLIESMLKRASGVKDSGTIIQGMGGLLDVLDSLLFSAPFLYLYLRLFMDTGV